MDHQLSLRERKKFQTMSSLLEEFIHSLENHDFHEISIENVCNKANLSKVTFFRYFNSKEEVLDYFVLRWCYQRSLEINRKAYFGLDGIRQVFKSAAEIPHAEKIFVALIHYYSKFKNRTAKRELSDYERYVISNSSTEGLQVKLLSLREIILHYLSQIKDLDPSMIFIYTDHLLTLFYGIPFQVHIQMLGPKSLLRAYMEQLEIISNQMLGSSNA